VKVLAGGTVFFFLKKKDDEKKQYKKQVLFEIEKDQFLNAGTTPLYQSQIIHPSLQDNKQNSPKYFFLNKNK